MRPSLGLRNPWCWIGLWVSHNSPPLLFNSMITTHRVSSSAFTAEENGEESEGAKNCYDHVSLLYFGATVLEMRLRCGCVPPVCGMLLWVTQRRPCWDLAAHPTQTLSVGGSACAGGTLGQNSSQNNSKSTVHALPQAELAPTIGLIPSPCSATTAAHIASCLWSPPVAGSSPWVPTLDKIQLIFEWFSQRSTDSLPKT